MSAGSVPLTISLETYAETMARAMANPVHSKGCGCKRCRP